jgi:chloramphenicol 3-O-phosphotransferase
MACDVIIIRGAPASGKSQTAKSLAKFFPKGVRLEVDALRQMVISVDWKNQAEHISVLQASIGLVCDFFNAGFNPVIVVDTFSGDKIKDYLERLKYEGLTVRVFGLFTSEEELNKRTDARSDEEFRDFDVCKKLNKEVIQHLSEGEVQIDTSNLTAEQTAESICMEILP